MSDFKAKMHQIRFRLELRPGAAYSATPDLLAGFKGPTSKGREGRGGEGPTYKGREVKGGEVRGKGRVPLVITVSPGSRGARIVTAFTFIKHTCAVGRTGLIVSNVTTIL